jgi:hypothetical protein
VSLLHDAVFATSLQGVAQRIAEVVFEMNEASRKKKLAAAVAAGAPKRRAPPKHLTQVSFQHTYHQQIMFESLSWRRCRRSPWTGTPKRRPPPPKRGTLVCHKRISCQQRHA